MPLQAGTRIGAFEITGLLGAGGMGEVYRARDLKLGREVAVKILPPALRSDPDRLARLAREARALAAINHPNIAAIYGVDEQHDTSALVLELVEGESLAAHLRRGPIPIGEASAIAKQIASALDAAHEKDIIHRDLKPANIMITPEGAVKVLDFGLAKVVEDRSGSDDSRSDTVTQGHTREGVILGTAAYMSPEQARGQRVDRRTDIWAFGCVLYEMLASRQAFVGTTTSDLLAAILDREPDWVALPAATPPAMRRLVKRCLEKDPRRRLRDIGDAWIETEGQHGESLRPAAPSGRLWSLALVAALLAGAGLGWLTAVRRSPAASAPTALGVFVETLPEGRQFEGGTAGTGSMVALSPDGRTLAYVAEEGTETRLFIRSLDRLDQLRASPITERGAREPFFSPNGQWLGFRVGQTLKRVFLQGGAVETIADLPPGTAGANGISWSPDGSILVGVGLTGLVRVAAAGGAVETLVTPAKERRIMFPQALPGGRAVLYTDIGAAADSSELVLLDLASGTPTPLRSGSNGRYLRTGHLVFVAAGTLWAVRFDVGRLKMNGAPVPVLTGVRVNPEVGAAQVALAESGALAYLPALGSLRTLVWVDRQGKETPVDAPPRAYGVPRVSPDGARIAVTMKDGGQDIHLWDVSRRLLRQLTFDASPNTTVAWLNNDRLTFSATVNGWGQVFEQRADGLEAARQVTRTLPSFPFSVSRDGAVIFVTEFPSDGAWDIGVVPVANPEMRQTVERTKDTETNPVLSPDGRWLTYQSNKTGRFEIYVRPFPLTGQGEVAVTDEGGTRPVWARDGSELYYWTAGRTSVAVKAIRITSGPPSSWDAPRMIVEGPFATTGRDTEYDAWDGRFLFMKEFAAGGVQRGREIVVVQNLNDEIRRLAPAK